jgi:Tfp pilus tip-associated adhesin PilY1
MEIDALTGKRLGDSPVDTNRDGKIDAADMVTDGTGSVAPGGFKSDVGIVSGVGIAADPVNPVEFKYMAGSKGQMQTVRESSPAKSRGRQSWRAVR